LKTIGPPPKESSLDYEEKPDPTFRLGLGVVCWLDLLGIKEQLAAATRQKKEDAFVADYLSVLRPIYASLDYDLSETDYRWNVFTDSIVLSVPVDSAHIETTTGLLCASAAEVQFRLSLRGWFARGAVSIGPLHASEEFVVGSGLLSAFQLEGIDAVVPRVIASSDVRRLLRTFLTYYSEPDDSPQNGYWAVDEDGQAFVNYLYTPIGLEYSPVMVEQFVKKHRKRLIEKLATHKDPGKIRAKYLWVAGYHNWFCEQWLPSAKSSEFKIAKVAEHAFARLA
jgi:hypothetical protein